MLVVLSPAKKLDWSVYGENRALGTPQFHENATELTRLAQGLGADGLKKLMHISDKLAQLNLQRFDAFTPTPAPEATRAAIYGFAGDTYTGLDARSLDSDALDWAHGHLRILSGLYGVLRPFDALQPYRLEMGSRLAGAHGKNLYDYWGRKISDALNASAAETGAQVLVNCASQEYFGAVDLAALNMRVITPVFMDSRDGAEPKIVSFYAKKARGAMARYILENRLRDAAALRDFHTAGYEFDPVLSEQDKPVFVRSV